MKRSLTIAASLFAFSAGAAAACDPGKPGAELSLEEAKAVYDCLSDRLYEGYNKGGKGWIPASYVADYRSWKAASTAPANPMMHQDRFLYTYVNDVGFDAYTRYEEDPTIPAGTVIAKVSFVVTDAGQARPGPLFIMEKTAEGASPETMDWYYMMVAANGRPQAVNVMTACNECHIGNYDFQGGLGYPVEDARLK